MKKYFGAVILLLILGLSAVPVLAETEGTVSEDAQDKEVQDTAKNILDSLKGLGNTSENSDVLTLYISGMDTRGDLSEASRSDVNIIATVNKSTKQILLVSTPRDYYVPLSISNGVPDKLTHAGVYGIQVSVETLEMLYDIDIDYYFQLNFKNFVSFIDALGGITVHSDYDFYTQNSSGYHVVAGDNLMDGETALAFARERYSFASGDRQRGRNQMYVIQGVMNKLGSLSLNGDMDALNAMADGFFVTDMPLTQRLQLLLTEIPQINDYQITTYSVDGTGASAKPYSMSQNAYVMIPDQETVDHAKELMAQVRDGEEIPVDWCKGYDEGAVWITELGENVAEGTEEKVEETWAGLLDGSIHVFDTATFTVGGEPMTTTATDELADTYYGVEYISEDGYFMESELASAPAFATIIDGITELNQVY